MKYNIIIFLLLLLSSLLFLFDVTKYIYFVIIIFILFFHYIYFVIFNCEVNSIIDDRKNDNFFYNISKKLFSYKNKIEEEKDNYKSIIDTLSTWYWELDIDGKITHVSNGVEKLGFSPEHMLDVYFYSIAENPSNVKNQFLNIVKKSNRNVNLFFFVDSNCQKKYIHMFGLPKIDNKNLVGYRCICIDKTYEKASYDKLLVFQKAEYVSNICSGIGHDLKNIVQTINLNSYLLTKKNTNKDLDNIIKSIFVSSENMKSLLQNLLIIAKGHINVEKCRFIFDDFFETNILPTLITPSNIKLNVSLNCGSSVVFGSKSQIIQLIMNLFVNACQSIDGVGNIDIKSFVKDNYVVISIVDNGCGMTEEQRTKVFDAFYTNKEHGAGLGLYMVYEIVKRHDGYIDIESTKDKGTKILVYIPRSDDV